MGAIFHRAYPDREISNLILILHRYLYNPRKRIAVFYQVEKFSLVRSIWGKCKDFEYCFIMTTRTLGVLILHEISPIPGPPAVLHKDSRELRFTPHSASELEARSNDGHTGQIQQVVPNHGSSPSATTDDLEMRGLPDIIGEGAIDVVQTLSNPPMNKYRLLSACLVLLGNGLNDSAPGALIPSIEKRYSVGYAVVSLIFVANAVGFISAAPVTHTLLGRIGQAKMLALAQCLMLAGYIVLVCSPPFPVVTLAFFLLGFGMAFNLALHNTFCANLANATVNLGFLHGSYGIGGTIGPLIATAMVSHGYPWSVFYFIALGLAVLNALASYFTFRTYEIDNPTTSTSAPPHSTPSRSAGNPPTSSKSRLLKESLRNRSTILGSLFIFAYQGAEVSISGWVISFLLSYRHSRPSHVGYVTAGFWGGITIGRFLLAHPAHKIGEKFAVAGLIIGASAFQVLVWKIPNVVGDAVAVSIVGLLLGPIYPCATAVVSRLVGRRLQMSSLATVSALGSSGGAVAPFFTGLLAQQVGTWVLHPICVALFGGMLLCWGGLPRGRKRRE